MPSVKERTFPSTDGKHKLIGKVYIPDGEPLGIFHTVHGMTEHIGRYDGFLTEMCKKGYVCVAYDNLGHGKTARKGELGYIADKNGWKLLADDVYSTSKIIKKEYPGLQYCLLGHSMGSFIVRLAVSLYPELADKLIVMGTGGPNPASGVALGIIGMIKLFRGRRHVSPMIEKLVFGKYNERFGEGTTGDWLSKDPEVRRTYNADKFCNYHFTVSALGDLIKLNREVNKTKTFSSTRSSLPILLMSGADDPVGDYGKGVQKVYELYKKYVKNVTLKLYEDNRHEILNDTARSEAVADILNLIMST